MIVRIQQTLFGQDLSSLSPEIVFLIAVFIVLIGLALAFAGRSVWKHMMSFVGGIIGGLFGFLIGAAVGGPLIGFVVGILGAFVGSALFIFLARLGLSLLAALLALVVVAAVGGNEIVALIAAAIVFIVAFVYVETAIGLVTAVVGGLMVGAGLFLMDVADMLIVVIAVLVVAVAGAATQMSSLKREKERKEAHHAVHHPVAAAAVAAPVPPPMPIRKCSVCGGPLTYIPEYNRYYCTHCQRYED